MTQKGCYLSRPSPYIPESSFLFHENQPAFSASGRIFVLDAASIVIYQGSPITPEQLDTGTRATLTLRTKNIIETAQIVLLIRKTTLLELFTEPVVVFSQRKYSTLLLLNLLSDEEKDKPAIAYMINTFSAMRKIGLEGKNAFWTAIGVAYLDHLLLPSTDISEFVAFNTQLNQLGETALLPYVQELWKAKGVNRGNELLDQYYENTDFGNGLISAICSLVYDYAVNHRERVAEIGCLEGENLKTYLEYHRSDLSEEICLLTALALPIKLKLFDSFELENLGISFKSDQENKELVRINLLITSNTFQILYTKAQCKAEGLDDSLEKRVYKKIGENTRKQLFSMNKAKKPLEEVGIRAEEANLMQKAEQILALQETLQRFILSVFDQLKNRTMREGVDFLTPELVNEMYDTKEKYHSHIAVLTTHMPDDVSRLLLLENPTSSFNHFLSIQICSKCKTHPGHCLLECGHRICQSCLLAYIQESKDSLMVIVSPDGEPVDSFVCPILTCVLKKRISKRTLMVATGDMFEDLVTYAENLYMQKVCKRCKRVQQGRFFHMLDYCGCKICDCCLIQNIKKNNGICDCLKYIPQAVLTCLNYSLEQCTSCGECKSLVDNFTPLKCKDHILCKQCLAKGIISDKRCHSCYRVFTDEELRSVKSLLDLPCELYCRGAIPIELLVSLRCDHSFCKLCAIKAYFHSKRVDMCYVCLQPLVPADIEQVNKLVLLASIKEPSFVTIPCNMCNRPVGLFQEIKLLCNHSFHKNCLKGYAENFVLTDFENPMKCPELGCRQEIDPNMLEQLLLRSELYNQYSKRLVELVVSGTITCPNMQCGEQFEFEGEYTYIACPRCSVIICKTCKHQMSENHDQKRCEFLQIQGKIELMGKDGFEVAQCPGCRVPYQAQGNCKMSCITPGCVKWCFKCSALQIPIDLHGKAWHRPNCPEYKAGDLNQVQSKDCAECQRLGRRCDPPKPLKVPQRFDIDEY